MRRPVQSLAAGLALTALVALATDPVRAADDGVGGAVKGPVGSPATPSSAGHYQHPDTARGGGGVFQPSLTFEFKLGDKPKQDRTPAPSSAAPDTDHAPDTVIFLLSNAHTDLVALSRRAGVAVVETAPLDSVHLLMVVAQLRPGDTPEAAIARLSLSPEVAWAQPDHLYQLQGVAEHLPRAFTLEGLTSDQMARPAPGAVAMIDAPVAINHEAFRNADIQQRLFGPSGEAGAHGTAVADLLVGQGDTPGSGRGARLVSLAAFRQADVDAPSVSQTRYLAKAFDAAVRLRPNVLNLSFGGPVDHLLETLLQALDAEGVCIVAAAGNGGRKGLPPFPASHPGVLGVTAVDENLRIYAFATPGPQVDVAAIGVDLVAAVPGGYRRVSGTSFAAAFVSGALLRLPACAQARDPAAMRAAVAAAARDLGPRGRDDTFGAGLFQLPASR